MSSVPVILLVEDNRLDVELAIDSIESAGQNCRVEVVGDGQRALDYLFGRDPYSDRDTYPSPALVLLDIKIAGISGLEVLRQIKLNRATKWIPVVMLTSSREHEDLEFCYNHHVNSYLVKPISYIDFAEVMKYLTGYWLGMNIRPEEASGPSD